MIKNTYQFLAEGVKNFHDTGTVCATSQWAADQLTHPLDSTEGNRIILELGAGTGAVTKQILKKLQPTDQLVICEINENFMETLKQNLQENELYKKHKERISFHCCPVQNLDVDYCFDTFIASLPFLNFEVSLVESIFNKLESIAAPGSILTYYQYMGLKQIGKTMSPKSRKDRLRKVEAFFDAKHKEPGYSHKAVWMNVLPIMIHTITIGGQESGQKAAHG